MTTRRNRAQASAGIVCLALATALTGCAGTGGNGPTTTVTVTETAGQGDPSADALPADELEALLNPDAPAAGALEDVTWTDAGEEPPTIDYEWPLMVPEPETRLINPGDGDEIEDGQRVDFDYLGIAGTDGSIQESTWEQGNLQSFSLSETQLDPVLYGALLGQKVGVALLYAVPGASEDGQSADPTQPANLIAMIVRNVATPLPRATGTPVTPPAGQPTVTLDESGAPGITIPDQDPPAEMVTQVLIKGAGAVVEEGQTVQVHYSGWLWDGSDTMFDSSWERGEPTTFPLTPGQLIDGWVEGLVGQTVGSQVLLVVPPDKGYGAEGSGETIPPDTTLIFVVDILDVAA